ncbi:hypothetical protein AK812_SmicGene8875 [Symbiodinium microadriaticum]|uniref:Uncharacterized protein n=1 Tax=Symbiodinium microadriaticum TaxID=2951 RepID=A0A1Q9EJY3_SYMMI|nr:hypothetical protein AK812_SmicGene8875 [Symbiodinium microadriaticum]
MSNRPTTKETATRVLWRVEGTNSYRNIQQAPEGAFMNGIFIAASTSSDFLSHARTREFDDAGDGHNPGEDDGRDMVNGGKRDDTDNPDAGRP